MRLTRRQILRKLNSYRGTEDEIPLKSLTYTDGKMISRIKRRPQVESDFPETWRCELWQNRRDFREWVFQSLADEDMIVRFLVAQRFFADGDRPSYRQLAMIPKVKQMGYDHSKVRRTILRAIDILADKGKQ